MFIVCDILWFIAMFSAMFSFCKLNCCTFNCNQLCVSLNIFNKYKMFSTFLSSYGKTIEVWERGKDVKTYKAKARD